MGIIRTAARPCADYKNAGWLVMPCRERRARPIFPNPAMHCTVDGRPFAVVRTDGIARASTLPRFAGFDFIFGLRAIYTHTYRHRAVYIPGPAETRFREERAVCICFVFFMWLVCCVVTGPSVCARMCPPAFGAHQIGATNECFPDRARRSPVTLC